MRQTKDVHPFILPHTWSTALESLSDSSTEQLSCGRYLVKGPQKCGKSTFARTLMNDLLGSYVTIRVSYNTSIKSNDIQGIVELLSSNAI